MTPADYGIISVYTTLASFFAILYNLGFDGALFRYYYEKHDDFDVFLGTNLISFFVISILMSGIFVLFGGFFSSMLGIKSDLFYYAIVVSIISVPYLLIQSYYQSIKNSKYYSYLSVIKFSSITILTIILVALLKDDKYFGRPYSEFIIGSLLLVFAIPKLLKLSKFKFKISHIKYALLFGIPLLPHSLSQLVLSFFDRIIINKVSGESDAGLYAFAFNIGMMMNVVIMGMNQSWVPILYEKLKNGLYNDIQSLASKYSKIIYLVAITFILFTNETVKILGEKRYLSSTNIVPIIIVGYTFVFLYTLYSNYAFYDKKTFSVSIITIVTGVISVTLNFTLVPIYGYKVSAITSMVSYFFLFFFHFVNVKYILKMEGVISLKIIYGKYIYIIIALGMYYLFNYIEISIIFSIFCNGILLMIYILIEFNLWERIIKKLK